MARAIYSVPGNLIGQTILARADRTVVKLYVQGQLIKVHPRQAPGGRATDPEDLPPERTAYALRDIDHLIRSAAPTGRRSASTSKPSWTTRCRGPRCARPTGCWAW